MSRLPGAIAAATIVVVAGIGCSSTPPPSQPAGVVKTTQTTAAANIDNQAVCDGLHAQYRQNEAHAQIDPEQAKIMQTMITENLKIWRCEAPARPPLNTPGK